MEMKLWIGIKSLERKLILNLMVINIILGIYIYKYIHFSLIYLAKLN